MPLPLEETSTITAKGQTTIPRSVRRALGVDYGGRIAFRVDEQGVTLHRVEEDQPDPTIESFLGFLASDLARHPERVAALSPTLAARVAALTEKMSGDLDAAIDGPVDL